MYEEPASGRNASHSAGSILRRRPLGSLALFLAVIKSLQFAADSAPLFFFDSGTFILNGLGLLFIAERSYFYGFLLRSICLPFGSLQPLIVAQVLMGGFTAWLVGFTLVRFFRVRFGLAALAAVVFAFDPKQIVHERMVMTETLALLVAALFLLAALQYARSGSYTCLVSAALLGMLLVAVRVAYLPAGLICSLSLPVVANLHRRTDRLRVLVLGLVIAGGATWIFHNAYRVLTGHLAGREPAYHYNPGLFLAAAVAPILDPGDTDDPRVASVVARQETAKTKLSDPGQRGNQRWAPGGLIAELRAAVGDPIALNQAALEIASRAILRNPLGFVRLGLRTYRDYWTHLPYAKQSLGVEHGIGGTSQLTAWDTQVILSHFRLDVRNNHRLQSLSRRYHRLAYPWTLFLLMAPFLSLAAVWFVPADLRLSAGFIAAWNWLAMAEVCLFAGEVSYRYLHPFSFTGLVAVAMLAEAVVSRTGQPAN